MLIYGIDISKKDLHVYSPKDNNTISITNDIKTIYKYFKNLELDDIMVVYEPTGIYGKNLEKVLNKLNIKHYLIHANDIHKLISALWDKNKNDTLDAKQIANIAGLMIKQVECNLGKNKLINPNSDLVNEMNAILTQIHFIKNQINHINQWIEVLSFDPYSPKECLKFYNKQVNNYNSEIDRLYNKLKMTFKELWVIDSLKNLETIPWIWEVIAVELLVFFLSLKEKWFAKEDVKKVISYTWLNPLESQSWTSLNKTKISKNWNKIIRWAMFMSWIVRSNISNRDKYKNTTIGKFCLRMKDKFSNWKRKYWKSVACAVWKKLLSISRTIFRSNSTYQYI